MGGLQVSTTDMTLLFLLQFDHPVFVLNNTLGASGSIKLPSCHASIELPRQNQSLADSRALLPPASTPAEFSPKSDEGWGMTLETQNYSEVNAMVATVKVRSHLDFDLSINQIGGDSVRGLIEELDDWFQSFSHWLWMLTAQPLDPINPDPKVLHRKSSNILFAGKSTTEMSHLSSGYPTIKIVMDTRDTTSERCVDIKVFSVAVTRAGNSQPPMMWELLASARMAGRRGDDRRALIDAGTAAEAALVDILNLPANHGKTLGNLVTVAGQKGFVLPPDIRTALVQPRNNAVHQGLASAGLVERALEIVEDLVVRADATYVSVSSLQKVHRPQRMDLLIFAPPKNESVDLKHNQSIRERVGK